MRAVRTGAREHVPTFVVCLFTSSLSRYRKLGGNSKANQAKGDDKNLLHFILPVGSLSTMFIHAVMLLVPRFC